MTQKKQILTSIVFLAAFSVSRAQGTLQVPSQFATINAAISAANNGDVILVAPGVYLENVDFLGKSIVVEGAAGAADSVIDGTQSGSVVTFDSGEGQGSVIRRLTLTGGINDLGAGIYCGTATSPIIESCIIRNNEAVEGYGGGIACIDNASPTIRNCVIRENCATDGGGGGVACIFGAAPTIVNCTIVLNDGLFGGGLINTAAAAVVINSILWSNTLDQVSDSGGLTISSSLVGGGWLGAGCCNISSSPQFVDLLGGDVHVEVTSPCVNSADSAAPGLSNTDFDGEPRSLFGAVDIGADEVSDIALDPCMAGTVGLASGGGPYNVLSVNGSFGGISRRVGVGLGQSILFLVTQPPTIVQPARFVIFGAVGVPTFLDPIALPFGIGSMCFVPCPFLPSAQPLLFTLTNNFSSSSCGQLLGSNPAPWNSGFLAGSPVPVEITFQSLIEETPGVVRVSNGVILEVN